MNLHQPINHTFLPNVVLGELTFTREYKQWLQDWLSKVDSNVENGDTATSICFQALLTEVILYGEPRHNWTDILDELLTDKQGNPLAYSEVYGQRLSRFAQWRQTPVHAVYSHYWIKRALAPSSVDERYADLIIDFIQPSGWIYNPKVSQTQLTTRMKSEYLMSFAMGLEILRAFSRLEKHEGSFKATLSSYPLTVFLSAEFFRVLALEILGATHFLPVGIERILQICEAGHGYCDFSVSEKVDDYMGTAKRTGRDRALHSPLSALQAAYISRYSDRETQRRVNKRLTGFAEYLSEHPFEIEAFQIRDLAIAFGTDLSPLELIAATSVIQNHTI